jgi:hypothetical protein
MNRLLPILTCFALLWSARIVRADVVSLALDHPRKAELAGALRTELAGFGHSLVLADDAAGASREAHALLWVPTDAPLRVRAASMGQVELEDAPLPGPLDSVSARVFANLATSVALRVLGRPVNPEPSAAPPPAANAPQPSEVAPPSEARSIGAERSLPAPAPREDPAQPRWFARLSGNMALPYVHDRQALDRSVTQGELSAASAQGASAEQVQDALAKRGFDCDVSSSDEQIVASQCGAAILSSGLGYVGGVALTLGAMLSERVGLAVDTRVGSRAGEGALSRALFGLSLELETLAPRATGFTLRLRGGVGAGRLQVSAASRHGGPYLTSGLGEVHAGIVAGYRFSAHFGAFVGAEGRLFFPTTLFAPDLSAGLEVRL